MPSIKRKKSYQAAWRMESTAIHEKNKFGGIRYMHKH